jgi:hypothetical protein
MLAAFSALAEKSRPSMRSLARPPTATNISPIHTGDSPAAKRSIVDFGLHTERQRTGRSEGSDERAATNGRKTT